MHQPMQAAGAMVPRKQETPVYENHAAKYRFYCEVIDNRTGERLQIYVDANTKASASKICRELGYSVRSMGFA